METTSSNERRTKEKRVNKKERVVGRKETYEVGEKVKLQNIKTKLWDLDGEVIGIYMEQVDTISSNDINSDGCVTTRHRRYMNSDEETQSDTEGTGMGGQRDSH